MNSDLLALAESNISNLRRRMELSVAIWEKLD